MKPKFAFILSAVLFLFGSLSFACIPLVTLYEKNLYATREPFFDAPVASPSQILRIRVDRFGKGYFGASRNHHRTHQGIDFIAALNDPIFAAKSGRVVRAAEEAGYGKHIYLLHPDGLVTRYAHLSFLNVYEGEWVNQGERIGACGKTGNAGNPRIIAHLHFEIRAGGVSLNPTRHDLFGPKYRFRY